MKKISKNIFIATGIYPPEIGGQAEYAKNLKEVWEKDGYTVSVGVFSKYSNIPSGIRHIIYTFYILPEILRTDYIFVIDTFSAALPAIFLAWIFGKKTVLRTGGDFLWEAYIERTDEKVTLSDFYRTKTTNFNFKERVLFNLIRWLFRHTDTIIWSTEWQKNIFIESYGLQNKNHKIVENYYGPQTNVSEFDSKNFIASGRPSKIKNMDILQDIFSRPSVLNLGGKLDTLKVNHQEFLEKVKKSYAVILVSLSDISPNVILDSIRFGKPFIVTKEVGIYERIRGIALFVDPLNREELEQKVLWLLDDKNYQEQKNKILGFNFTHTWEEIAFEYMMAYHSDDVTNKIE
ncbi:MAG: hypothetical protein WC095_03050 [Candidatus Paceibacterota bacterium]